MSNFQNEFIKEVMPQIMVNLGLEGKALKKQIFEELTKDMPTKTIVLSPVAGETLKDEITHKQFETLLKLVNQRIPVLIFGEAGTGKNHSAEQVARALDIDFYFTGSVTQEYKLTGFIDANGTFQETQFYKAFKNGGLFFLDEVDASTPEALIILNAALANGYFDFPNGRVDAHPDFRVIAGANTNGKGADAIYVGRNRLDGASLDRFSVMKWEYDEHIENISVGEHLFVADIGRMVRKIVHEKEIQHIVSPRAMKHAAIMFAEQFKWDDIFEMTFLKGLSRDDKNSILSALLKEESFINGLMPAFATDIKRLKRNL